MPSRKDLLIWFVGLIGFVCLGVFGTDQEEWDAQVQSECWPTFHPGLPLCKLLGGFQWNIERGGGPCCCKSGCFDVNQDGHVDLEDFAILQNLVGEEAWYDTDGSYDTCGYVGYGSELRDDGTRGSTRTGCINCF